MPVGRLRRLRRRGPDGDEGFVLLETIIAIALITVLMVALTALFINAMQSTVHQRATQGAVRIATDEIDQARGLGAVTSESVAGGTSVLSGRDKSSVLAQYDAAPAKVRGWLSSRDVQAYDTSAAAGTGNTACPDGTIASTCAPLPTTPVVRTVNSTAYSVNYYLQWCLLDPGDAEDAANGTPDCSDASVGTDPSVRQYVRVVIALGWSDSTCPAGGCSYITSVMLSDHTDPEFNFRTPPPPAPELSGCLDQDSNVDDEVDLAITGADGLCALESGVPPFTWSGTGLPDGVAVIAAGTITGSPSAPGDFEVTLTVTDAFLRTASASFDWEVSYPPLVPVNPDTQRSTVGAEAAPVTLTATGGSGHYVFSDPNATLPPGVTLAGNEITGIPTRSDNFPVTITVTDATAGMSGTISFMWAVSPPPSVSPPSNTTTAPGGTVSGQAVGTAGAPPYTFALLNAPDWLQIDPSTGVLSGTASDDVADYPDIVIQLTDARGAVATSAPFTWSVYEVPTLVPPGDQTSDLGATVALQLEATCGVEPCIFSADGLPDGISLNSSTGLISGQAPSNGGLFTDITVSITDGRGTSVSSKFAWVVGPKQTISTPDDQVWTVGRALQSATSTGLQIAAECSAAPCTYGLAAGSGPLPTGLTLNTATGLITGTPTNTGTWTNIIVSVTNAVGVPAAASPISWTINPQPTLTLPSNQRTVAGDSVSLQLGYTCQSQPCAFTSTSLPPGLSLGDDGKISGSATTGGKSTVTVNVTDKSGATASRTFAWYVLQMTTMPDLQLTQQGNSGKCNGTNLTQTLTNYLVGYSDTTSINFTADRTDLVRVTGTRLDVITNCKVSINATVTITARDIGGSAPAATVSTTFRLRITS